MTFHNLQNSLLYRLKTQVIALSKFPPGGSPRTLLAHSLGSPTVLNSSLRVWIPHVIDKKFQLGSRGKGFWSFAFINIYMHACKWGEFCGCAQRNFCLLRNQKWRSFKISTDQSPWKEIVLEGDCHTLFGATFECFYSIKYAIHYTYFLKTFTILTPNTLNHCSNRVMGSENLSIVQIHKFLKKFLHPERLKFPIRVPNQSFLNVFLFYNIVSC